jgi:hypothetical protein
MAQSSQLTSDFDRFLFAPLDEDGERPLSVLSALARQNIDAWEEAERLAQLPKDHAVNSLASTIWKSDSKHWSPSAASIAAVRLVGLLPSRLSSRSGSIPTDSSNTMTMWLLYSIIVWSVAASGNISQQTGKEAGAQRANVVAEQHVQSTPAPILRASGD